MCLQMFSLKKLFNNNGAYHEIIAYDLSYEPLFHTTWWHLKTKKILLLLTNSASI